MLNRLIEPYVHLLPENNRIERIWKLAQVDFRKRYYNDRLGLFWAFLNPLSRVLIYYIVFTFIMDRVREGIPNFALFMFSAIICWMAFVETSKTCMKVLSQKSYLIENIQLNKIDLYISSGISTLLGFAFNLLAYLAFATILGTNYSVQLLLLPILIANIFLVGIGLGMILSIVYIYLKDINHLVDIIFIFGFWSSGIFFPADTIKSALPFFYYLNPFLGIFQNIRALLVYNESIYWPILFINLFVGVIIFAIGFQLVRKYSYFAVEKI